MLEILGLKKALQAQQEADAFYLQRDGKLPVEFRGQELEDYGDYAEDEIIGIPDVLDLIKREYHSRAPWEVMVIEFNTEYRTTRVQDDFADAVQSDNPYLILDKKPPKELADPSILEELGDDFVCFGTMIVGATNIALSRDPKKDIYAQADYRSQNGHIIAPANGYNQENPNRQTPEHGVLWRGVFYKDIVPGFVKFRLLPEDQSEFPEQVSQYTARQSELAEQYLKPQEKMSEGFYMPLYIPSQLEELLASGQPRINAFQR